MSGTHQIVGEDGEALRRYSDDDPRRQGQLVGGGDLGQQETQIKNWG